MLAEAEGSTMAAAAQTASLSAEGGESLLGGGIEAPTPMASEPDADPETMKNTGYVYTAEMAEHCILDTADGEHKEHPESPHRITRIFAKIAECGLLPRLTEIPCRPATDDEIESMHKAAHRKYVDTIPSKVRRSFAPLSKP
jgi:hypothetical protein